MVVCIGSTIGKVGMTSQRCLTNQQINSVLCKDGHDPLAVFYALRRQQQLFKRVASCTAVPILNKGNFAELTIPYYPEGTEEAVSEVLKEFEKAETGVEEIARVLRILKMQIISSFL